jgi:hypothetical protein
MRIVLSAMGNTGAKGEYEGDGNQTGDYACINLCAG